MTESLSMMATTGLLGYGFGEDAFRHGLDMDLDFIAADAGSMDPGPHYLGAGVPFVSRKAIKRDRWRRFGELSRCVFATIQCKAWC